MKQFLKSHAILFSMLAVLIGCLIYPNQADAKTYQTQDNYIGGGGCSVVISGNKVYYSITETGKIFCYDIKTKKTKTIAKAGGKGFRSLRKKEIICMQSMIIMADPMDQISISCVYLLRMVRKQNLQEAVILYLQAKRSTIQRRSM